MGIQIRRGDVFYADLNPAIGSEQGGIRPVLVIQNNLGNQFSPTVLIAPITSKVAKKVNLPTHCKIEGEFLELDSMVLLEQIRTIDKTRLGKHLGRVDVKQMNSLGKAIKISTGLIDPAKEKNKNDRRRVRKFS